MASVLDIVHPEGKVKKVKDDDDDNSYWSVAVAPAGDGVNSQVLAIQDRISLHEGVWQVGWWQWYAGDSLQHEAAGQRRRRARRQVWPVWYTALEPRHWWLWLWSRVLYTIIIVTMMMMIINKSSTVAEMTSECCITRTVKRWGWVSFQEKSGENLASAYLPKTRIFRATCLSQTVWVFS